MMKKIATKSFGLTCKLAPVLFITLLLMGALAVRPAYSQNTTTTTVAPDPSTVTIGNTITYTATVTDTSASPTTPTGTVSWSDGSAGGSFSNSGSCTLVTLDSSSASCTIDYTPPSSSRSVIITATYGGDSGHDGSSGTSSLTVVTPAQATQNLIDLVNSLNLPHGLTNSLNVKLQAAMKSLNRGNQIAAKNQLKAFMNQVKAKCCNRPPAKPLTTSQANMLIADAQEIIQAIT